MFINTLYTAVIDSRRRARAFDLFRAKSKESLTERTAIESKFCRAFLYPLDRHTTLSLQNEKVAKIATEARSKKWAKSRLQKRQVTRFIFSKWKIYTCQNENGVSRKKNFEKGKWKFLDPGNSFCASMIIWSLREIRRISFLRAELNVLLSFEIKVFCANCTIPGTFKSLWAIGNASMIYA